MALGENLTLGGFLQRSGSLGAPVARVEQVEVHQVDIPLLAKGEGEVKKNDIRGAKYQNTPSPRQALAALTYYASRAVLVDMNPRWGVRLRVVSVYISLGAGYSF